jgi:hypothetical protein
MVVSFDLTLTLSYKERASWLSIYPSPYGRGARGEGKLI